MNKQKRLLPSLSVAAALAAVVRAQAPTGPPKPAPGTAYFVGNRNILSDFVREDLRLLRDQHLGRNRLLRWLFRERHLDQRLSDGRQSRPPAFYVKQTSPDAAPAFLK